MWANARTSTPGLRLADQCNIIHGLPLKPWLLTEEIFVEQLSIKSWWTRLPLLIFFSLLAPVQSILNGKPDFIASSRGFHILLPLHAVTFHCSLSISWIISIAHSCSLSRYGLQMSFSSDLGVQAFWDIVDPLVSSFVGYKLASGLGLRFPGIGLRITDSLLLGLVEHNRSSEIESMELHSIWFNVIMVNSLSFLSATYCHLWNHIMLSLSLSPLWLGQQTNLLFRSTDTEYYLRMIMIWNTSNILLTRLRNISSPSIPPVSSTVRCTASLIYNVDHNDYCTGSWKPYSG